MAMRRWRANRQPREAGPDRVGRRVCPRLPLALEQLEDRCLLASSLAFGQLPLAFEANRGQASSGVDYVARGQGYTLTLSAGKALMGLHRPGDSGPGEVLGLNLLGANPRPAVIALDGLAARVNYYIGNDPTQWHPDVPTYGKVGYQAVYPGVDLIYYGNHGRLEYDLVVGAGANLGRIRLTVTGAQSVTLDAQGNLLLHTAEGDLVEQAPTLYQEVNGVRQAVSGRYVIQDGGTIGFAVGAYDQGQPLTIDPVLNYSTYLGGTGSDQGLGVAIDSQGFILVTGSASSDLLQRSPVQQGYGGGASDAFVAKIDPTKSGDASLIYMTFVGGTGTDVGRAIAADAAGNAHFTGQTTSTNFPTFSNGLFPIQTSNGGAVELRDAFIGELDAAGKAVYSTYYGGGADEDGRAIAVAPNGTTYVAGDTFSTDFRTSSFAAQPSLRGLHDAFVVRINPDSTLNYSTLLGGSGDDFANAIALDAAGNVYVAGQTGSSDFPTANPFQGALFGATNAFITKINPTGQVIVSSTYLGGSGNDSASGIAVDGSGSVTVVGTTSSGDFPATLGSYQPLAGTHNSFKSTDGGSTWRPINYRLAEFTVGQMVVDPTDASVVYAAGNPQAAPVEKSVDGGSTWASSSNGLPTRDTFRQLAIDPHRPQTLYATFSNDPLGRVVFRTTDGGNFWAAVPGTGLPAGIAPAAFAVDSLGMLFLDGSSGGVFRSADGGTTWVGVNVGLTAPASAIAIAIAPSNPQVIYLEQQAPADVYRSTDGGNNWAPTHLNQDLTSLVVDPADSSTVYGWGSAAGLQKTTDGGTTWTAVGKGFPSTAKAVRVILAVAPSAPGTVYAGTLTSGLFKSTDGALTWLAENNGLTNPSISAVAVAATDANTVYTGNQGGGSDAFVAKLNVQGVGLVYATYLGGGGNDSAAGLALDAAGDPSVVGTTSSSDFPTANPIQHALGGGRSDGFLAQLNSSGSALLSSTYFGGSGDDAVNAVAVDSVGAAYIVGTTTSTDLPEFSWISNVATRAPFQTSIKGGSDAFVEKIIPGNLVFVSPNTIAEGHTTFNFRIRNDNNLFADPLKQFVVQWNGAPLATAFFAGNSTDLLATVPASLVGDEGVAYVSVKDRTSGLIGELPFTITDAPMSDQTQPSTLNAVEGLDTGDLIVSTFIDANPNGLTTDFSASQIDWGDGSAPTSPVLIQATQRFPDRVVYAVHGRHVYADERATPYQVTVSIQDDGSTQPLTSTNTRVSIGDAPLMNTTPSSTFTPAENTDSGLLTLATFTDGNASALIGDFTATVSWGDGATATMGVVAQSQGHFAVQGNHKYREAGSYPVTVVVRDVGGQSFTAANTLVRVLDAGLTDQTAQSITSSVVGVDTQPLLLATFADANPDAPLTDFKNSTISWGDGTVAPAPIQFLSNTGGSAVFNVVAEHAYQSAGSYVVRITFTDVDGSSVSTVLTETAYAPEPVSATATEGIDAPAAVATFKDPDAVVPDVDPVTKQPIIRAIRASDFSATIDWGDGHTGLGTVMGDRLSSFRVQGTNTYADEGAATVTVTLTGIAGGGTFNVKGVATIFDAPLTASGSSFAPAAGTAFTGGVATFTDANAAGAASDFTATIAWGDGSTSSGSIAAATGGGFTVAGTHTYAGVATYQTSVMITDRGGAQVDATGTARVGFGPPPGPGPNPGPGSGTLAAATSGSSSVIFVVTPGNSLFRHDDARGWFKLGDNIQQISASAEASGNAVVFAVTKDHAFFRFDTINGWQMLGAPGTVLNASAGTDLGGLVSAFVITGAGDFTEYRGSSGWAVSPIGARGTILQMSAADRDRVAVVTTDHSVLEYDRRVGWFALTGPGFAQSISAIGDVSGRLAVFAVAADAALWTHQDGTAWTKIGGSGSILTVNAGTDLAGAADAFAVTAAHDLAEFRSRTGQWALLYPGNPHPATELAATAVDRLFMTLGDGSVYGKDEVAGIFQLATPGFAQP